MEPSQLGDIYGMNPGAFWQAQDQIGLAQQMKQQQLAQQKQEYDFAAQKQPFSLEKMRLENQQTQAQIPGLEATSSMQQDKAKLSKADLPFQLDNKQKEWALKMSEQEVAQIETQAQKMLYSLDPAQQAQGRKLLEASKAVITERMKQAEKHKNDMSLQQLKESGDTQRANIAAGASRYSADQATKRKGAGGAGGIASLQEQLVNGKLTLDKAAVLLQNAAMMAEADGDTETAAKYSMMANQYLQQFMLSKQMGAVPGLSNKIDVPGTSGLPRAQTPAATPMTLPGASKSPPIENNPATADPNLKMLPEGSKALGGGVYQLPDGRKVKKN